MATERTKRVLRRAMRNLIDAEVATFDWWRSGTGDVRQAAPRGGGEPRYVLELPIAAFRSAQSLGLIEQDGQQHRMTDAGRAFADK